MRRVRPALFALSLVVLVTASGATAAPQWLPPHDLTFDNGNAQGPQVALDSTGDALVAWYRWNDQGSVIQVAEHPPGREWALNQDLSVPGHDAYAPRLAVNASGAAVTVWYASSAADSVIQAAFRPVNSMWRAPQDLSDPGGRATSPDVAVDQLGNAVAVWQRFDGTHWIVQAAIRPAGSESWLRPENLSVSNQDSCLARVVTDSGGGAIAVWQQFDGQNWIVETATLPPGSGLWSAPQPLSAPGEDAENARVAFDPSRNALAVWERFDGAHWIVQSAVRPAPPYGGAWSPPQDVSPSGHDAHGPQVAFDRWGNALAIWAEDGDSVQGAERPAGGIWGYAEVIARPGQLTDDAQLALDPRGDAVVVWRRSDEGANGVVQAVRRPIEGAWGAPQDLSPTGSPAFEPAVAVDPAGNTVAAWSVLSNGIAFTVQADALDAAGPVFENLSIRARRAAGSQLRFSVSSFDVWTGIGELPHWRFGDGHSADGYAVRHAYATRGTYTVTLSEPDSIGNVSSISRTISIGGIRCVVPRVVGATLVGARAAIKRSHCRIGFVDRVFSTKVRKGHVAAQRPRAGKSLPRGARVDLVVSRGRRR